MRAGFHFADERDGDAFRFPELRHPLAQRRDRDLAADDDDGKPRVGSLEPHEHDQCGDDDQLVRDRVEKRAERRRLPPAARQITVGPVGDGRERKRAHRQPVLALHRQ